MIHNHTTNKAYRSLKLVQSMLFFVMIISAASAYAQESITTTFAANNLQNGNMFDATTLGSQLTVTGIDINPDSTGTYTIEVYTKPGSYIGSETTPGDWTLVSTTQVTVPTAGVPTFVDVTDFILPADSVTGMYITGAFGNLLRYTNGSNTYSNDDIMLTLGVGKSYPFGATFSPRTWNGTIYYQPSADLAYGQITIDTTPGHEDQDHARFKMTSLTGLGEAAALSDDDDVELVFTIENDYGEIAYTFNGIGIVEGNRLSLHQVAGDGEEKITCRLSTELCVIFIERDVDIDETVLDDNPLTISLEVNGTEYSNTGDWAGEVSPERTVYNPALSVD